MLCTERYSTSTERDNPAHISVTRDTGLLKGKRDGTRVDPSVKPGLSPSRDNPRASRIGLYNPHECDRLVLGT